MDKIKSRFNSFSGKITLIVMLGISLIAVTVSFVVLVMSRQVFTKNYGDSQEKVFEQIEKEFNDFHDHIQNVFDAIDSSWAFRLYFNETPELDNTQTFQNVYQMEQDLEKSKSADMERLNILVVGYNGKHYLSRTENICVTDQEILQSEPAKKALSDPDVIHYTYTGQAYTTTSRNADTLIISKALYYHESREVYAIAFVTLTMEELKQYYNYFVSDTTSFYLVDDHEIVLCSDRPGITGTHLQEEWFEKIKNADELRMELKQDSTVYTLMKRILPYQKCAIYALIDNDVALQDLYNMPFLIASCSAIGIFILMACLFYTHKTMRPLAKLIGKMSAIREGNFSEYMTVEGTTEVQELASTYNYMLDDLNEYLKAGLHTYQQLLKRNVGVSVNGWNEFISAFQNGSVASVISGGWIVSSIKSVEEQSGLWRVVPIPVYDGEIKTVAASNVGGSAWYVLKNAKNPDAAVDFLVEMFEKDSDFMNELIGEIGLLPAVKDMSGYENYLAKDEFFGGQQVTKILTDLSGNIITVNYGSKTYEIEAIVEDEFNNSLTQDNLSDCLSNIQVKAAAVVRE